ncbi:Co2+/Mg2+ efflux protein ApaG [Candidatus Anaplasma sp. TIGMIC]|uniref:Co2+/Mg2+ efflux protein ApaG n=1 Tax=Candidatus Anaplasma sp. TIGMIC TaxID=3020713 RepID=UPI00232AA4D6|nr:Co2+/Mg2+ efflux protein ApaG [Candidatus Anaplasma sp. TIGMIC]MDB1135745.1 Co2+/Mg2+ efflux protein ApaG [Candidatus Anaplasma sp. TIGMIC]
MECGNVDGLIEVEVTPSYLEEHSMPHENCYIWLYSVRINNKSSSTIQLLKRSWKIIDSKGTVNEGSGAGVAGSQPVLRPGTFFEYTSGTCLSTPSGVMNGWYQFVDEDKAQVFYIDVPAISLDSPYDSVRLH